MPSIEFILGGVLILLLYPIFIQGRKSYQDFFKKPRVPDPPTKEGPSAYDMARTCLSDVVRLVLIGLVVLWLGWLILGL